MDTRQGGATSVHDLEGLPAIRIFVGFAFSSELSRTLFCVHVPSRCIRCLRAVRQVTTYKKAFTSPMALPHYWTIWSSSVSCWLRPALGSLSLTPRLSRNRSAASHNKPHKKPHKSLSHGLSRLLFCSPVLFCAVRGLFPDRLVNTPVRDLFILL